MAEDCEEIDIATRSDLCISQFCGTSFSSDPSIACHSCRTSSVEGQRRQAMELAAEKLVQKNPELALSTASTIQRETLDAASHQQRSSAAADLAGALSAAYHLHMCK